MIVVSNTSPLTNLAAIGQFNLLHAIYDEIYIAEGVWQELNAYGKAWPGQQETAASNWISQQKVENQNLVTALQRDLDRGEAESVALALELNADLIILDEREGRHIARHLGLNVIGVLGVLLEAKHKNHIDKVQPQLDLLRQKAGFYLSDSVYIKLLTLANE